MAFPTLPELKHQADYDPIARFKQGEALSAADGLPLSLPTTPPAAALQPSLKPSS